MSLEAIAVVALDPAALATLPEAPATPGADPSLGQTRLGKDGKPYRFDVYEDAVAVHLGVKVTEAEPEDLADRLHEALGELLDAHEGKVPVFPASYTPEGRTFAALTDELGELADWIEIWEDEGDEDASAAAAQLQALLGGQMPDPAQLQALLGGQMPDPAQLQAMLGGQMPDPAKLEAMLGDRMPDPAQLQAMLGDQAPDPERLREMLGDDAPDPAQLQALLGGAGGGDLMAAAMEMAQRLAESDAFRELSERASAGQPIDPSEALAKLGLDPAQVDLEKLQATAAELLGQGGEEPEDGET